MTTGNLRRNVLKVLTSRQISDDPVSVHYGSEPSVSALYLKVPERGLTLLLLSNSNGLSAGMAWSDLGIHASPYARLFLEHFVSRSPKETSGEPKVP